MVDDGSRDETSAEVEKIAQTDGRVRLVRQTNRGKAVALQRGLALLHHELVVFLDADTHLQTDTLRHARPADARRAGGRSFGPRQGRQPAQLHRALPGARIHLRLQSRSARLRSLELHYRRAGRDQRHPSLRHRERAGGLSLDTLAEDTDLTLALHKGDNRIVYMPDAIAWTEAPETLRTLARQRFRWAYGTLQCLWKHRDKVFNWRYRALGWFSLPSVWFFQILLVALTPMVDLFLIASLPFGAWRAVLPFVVIFLAMDVILATLACILEREPILRAWRILPMRLIYRPLLSYVIWKAILRAIKGAWVGWGKLERTARVPVRV